MCTSLALEVHFMLVDNVCPYGSAEEAQQAEAAATKIETGKKERKKKGVYPYARSGSDVEASLLGAGRRQ